MVKQFTETPIDVLKPIYKEFHNLESVRTVVKKVNDQYMISDKKYILYSVEIYNTENKKVYETYIASKSYKKASRTAYEQYEQELTF